MRTEYGALLEKLSSYYDRTAFDGFSHFAGMRGYRYSRQPKLRMLIVGRSVNGWPSASEGLSAAEFGKHMESIFLDDACNGFSWIKRDTDTGCFTNGEDRMGRTIISAVLISGTIQKLYGEALMSLQAIMRK